MANNKTNWAPVHCKYSPPVGVPGVVCIKVEVPKFATPEEERKRMRIVIGHNGKVFKSITYESYAHYIWYDKKAGMIEVWGFFHKAANAVKRVNARIDMIKNLPEESLATFYPAPTPIVVEDAEISSITSIDALAMLLVNSSLGQKEKFSSSSSNASTVDSTPSASPVPTALNMIESSALKLVDH